MTVFKKFGFEICNFKHWSCDILERYCRLNEEFNLILISASTFPTLIALLVRVYIRVVLPGFVDDFWIRSMAMYTFVEFHQMEAGGEFFQSICQYVLASGCILSSDASLTVTLVQTVKNPSET